MTAAVATVRAFLACEVPDEVRRQLATEQHCLRAELPRARWVRIEGIHLTLKFLGEVGRDTVDDLCAELAPEIAELPRITVSLAGSGFFPSPRRPRVAWVGGRADGIEPVVEKVERVAANHGFDRERRPWSLHLTMARLNRGWPNTAVESFLAWGVGLRFETFTCSEVVMTQSSLQPTGAVYTALQRMPLK